MVDSLYKEDEHRLALAKGTQELGGFRPEATQLQIGVWDAGLGRV